MTPQLQQAIRAAAAVARPQAHVRETLETNVMLEAEGRGRGTDPVRDREELPVRLG